MHAGPAPKRRQFRNNPHGKTQARKGKVDRHAAPGIVAGPCCDNSSPERAQVWTRPYRLLLVLPAMVGRTLAGRCLCQPRSCVVEPFAAKAANRRPSGKADLRNPTATFADRTGDWKAPRITRAHASARLRSSSALAHCQSCRRWQSRRLAATSPCRYGSTILLRMA